MKYQVWLKENFILAQLQLYLQKRKGAILDYVPQRCNSIHHLTKFQIKRNTEEAEDNRAVVQYIQGEHRCNPTDKLWSSWVQIVHRCVHSFATRELFATAFLSNYTIIT